MKILRSIRSSRLSRMALPTVALLLWAGFVHAESKQGASLGDVKVTSGGTGPGPSGTKKGTVSLGDDSGKPSGSSTKLVPPTHTVKKGDTLWDLCDSYYGNPWQWPRVWSYNPEILNPHWIYPGEIVRLKKEGGISPAGAGGDQNAMLGPGGKGGVGTPGFSLKPQLVKSGTVFLRTSGFVNDKDVETTGQVTGSPEDKMLLSAPDRVFLKLTPEQTKNIGPGDSMTVFKFDRPVKNKGGGTVGNVVQILGTVKIVTVNKDTNVAEAVITESLDVIERGDARVGPVDRKIDVVPAAANEVELRGEVLESIHPNQMFGQNQIVMVDKGEKDGLKPGNRLFVVRRGDPWQEGLSSSGAYTASKVTLSTDGPSDIKSGQEGEQSKDYPEVIVAELRVVRVRKESATCMVTMSKSEISRGDSWKANKGY